MLRDGEELSTIVEISEQNVKTRLHRARQALRMLLEPFVLADQLA